MKSFIYILFKNKIYIDILTILQNPAYIILSQTKLVLTSENIVSRAKFLLKMTFINLKVI
jgi:hypothetical protein